MRSVTGADGCAGYHRLMDIDQARTFLAVAHHGSFVAASESLHITQTAVSARIRQLETQLDARLFVRDKTGARMTAAGERFVKYATAIVGQWEDARQQVGVPRGRAKVMRVGGEPSLWSPLLVDWLVWMKRHCSDAAVRVEVEVADRLVERVQQGTLDLAVVYGPPQRPNLIVELLAEEKLVMVTTSANGRWQPDSYVHVDWGAARRFPRSAARRCRVPSDRWRCTISRRSAAQATSGPARRRRIWRRRRCSACRVRPSSRTPCTPSTRPAATPAWWSRRGSA